jgi:hypothetical protein
MKYYINYDFKCYSGIGNDSYILEAENEKEAKEKFNKILSGTKSKKIRKIAQVV